MVNISKRIKYLREKADISQKQLATRIGVSPSLISAYELGTRLPSYDNLIKISHYFKVSTDYLLGVERTKSLDLSGLSEEQKVTLYKLVRSMRP